MQRLPINLREKDHDDVRENDPFADRPPAALLMAAPPVVGRITALREAMRAVVGILPPAPGPPKWNGLEFKYKKPRPHNSHAN